jgi:hypothetical protein
MDDEGETIHQVWRAGNPDAAEPLADVNSMEGILEIDPGSGVSAMPGSDGVIRITAANGSVTSLIAPKHATVAGLVFSSDGRCLIAVTRTHRVFSWDLHALRRE